MKDFLHDTNAFQDEKISELYIEFGYEGVGLFYTILEKLAAQEKPIKTIVLKKQLNVGKKLEKCWSFMESLGIISSNNGETFNKQLLNYAQKYKIKKEKNAKRISEWRDNQEFTENVTRSEQDCNTPKVKESKVKESKEIVLFEAAPKEKTKFDLFVDWQKENTPSLLKMKEPFTEKQYLKLREKYSYEQLIDMCQKMHNSSVLVKKYTSANLTFQKWIKRNYDNRNI